MFTPALSVLAATFLGGVLTVFFRRSERVFHVLVAFATGLFLGIVFFHLLPEAWGPEPQGGLGSFWRGAFVLAGVLAPFLVENLLLPGRQGSEAHRTLGWGSFFGLSVHALANGLGWAATSLDPDPALQRAVFLSLLSHKLPEGFSLATVLLLGGGSRSRALFLLLIFSCVTPAGLLLGRTFFGDVGPTGIQALVALASGTFLFVALCDLLPEIFHERVDAGKKLALLAAGIAASFLVEPH